jgi:hypothetical protein
MRSFTFLTNNVDINKAPESHKTWKEKEIQEKSIQEELAEDIISIIHSFSGKLYEMRSKIKEKLDKELSD